ncbi:AMP-binding protein [Paenibacillus sp. ISL-20]|uniref:AMP-binding protein n=1 Tax=Paenibacillus sp. ISL-20 TaxID=2819163 RepID=UPI001BE7BA02|nr:AMP-binding protein [Paenibacillus sp. ISL-20]MBT2765873.1 AMP-binding protein [Paenibacillus sp. ISL-20]
MQCSSLSKPRFFHEYFLQFTSKMPDQIAIISNNGQWTYAQLAQQSEEYAKAMEDIGLPVGERVILEFEPCPEAVALMIACSIQGLVFIPVNPDSPQERLESIITKTEAKLYIQKERVRSFPQYPQLINAYLKENTIITDSASRPQDKRKNMKLLENNLVYIIFTSGSTGEPKGIMMSHGAVLSFFEGIVHFCDLPEQTRVGSISPLQFDFSIMDMGLTFGSGGTLVLVPHSLVYHPKRFLDFIEQQQVFQMNGVPSIWKNILQYASQNNVVNSHLNSILFGGEFFPIDDLRRIQSLFDLKRLINAFGQSESIACSFKNIETPIDQGVENLSVGSGIYNAEMLLIDEKGHLIEEPYITGEIYLRGSCLFSGYWRNEVLTKKRLVPSPLSPDSGEIVFQSGDLAYKDESGEFYFIGRSDHQVKILGNRIELEEVERRLLSHPDVSQVCIIVQEESNSPQLHAFVQLHDHGDQTKTTQNDLRRHCAETLPSYMLPAKFEFFETLPLNANGKVDRNALKRQLQTI